MQKTTPGSGQAHLPWTCIGLAVDLLAEWLARRLGLPTSLTGLTDGARRIL